MYAVAWNCRPKRGWKETCEICCDDEAEVEGGLLRIDREADRELLVIDVCSEGEENVTKPRVVLGLAADNGPASAELLLLAERSIIVMGGGTERELRRKLGLIEVKI